MSTNKSMKPKSKANSKPLDKAFVMKHLTTELKGRGLMISGQDGSKDKIKEILGNYYVSLANKIEYVLKVVANKKIITEDHVSAAYNMM